jgi:hypothetical protein
MTIVLMCVGVDVLVCWWCCVVVICDVRWCADVLVVWWRVGVLICKLMC